MTGALTAVCLVCFVFYRFVTSGQKRRASSGKVCQKCGTRLTLFNRALDAPDLCGRCVNASFPHSIKVNCPECGTSLKGATSEMVGETGVCPKCKAEFEIKRD